MTADEWRERLAALPHKDIHRLLKSEPAVATQVSAGFRPGAESLKSPVVLKRLAEALPKNPKLAEAVEKLKPAAPSNPTPEPTPALEPTRLVPQHPGALWALQQGRVGVGSNRVGSSAVGSEKLKEQRAALKEKDRQLAEQAKRLAELEKERDAARVERDTERKAREAVESKLERERRRKIPEPVLAPVPVAPQSPTPALKELPSTPPTYLSDALTRLLQRGHDATVLALCRELLTDTSLPIAALAGVRVVYARALGSLGAPDAPEQCRLAADSALSAGQVMEAAELLLSAFTKPVPSAAERALLQRLLALAERLGELEALGRLFARQRLAQPLAFACLSKGLELVGKKYPALVPTASLTTLGPDTTVALPTAVKRAASFSARQLVAAVEQNDRALVLAAREGLEPLRTQNPELAEALLSTIGKLSTPALRVLTASRLRPIVVDASNVARHIADPLAAVIAKKPTASLPQLLQLRAFLLQHGFFPVYCIADANLRHLIKEKAQYAALVEKHVIRETLPGTSADELLLAEARAHQAPLVTNDRLADWGKHAEGIERLGFTLHNGTVSLFPER